MKNFRKILLLSACILLPGLIACGGSSEPVVSLESFAGQVEVKTSADSAIKKAEKGLKIFNGGSVQADEESEAVLKFLNDQTQIKLAQNTHFEIRNFSKNDLKQMRGIAIYQVSPQKVEMKIETPHGVATVLGTTFILDVAATNTALIVEKGKVGFKDGSGEVIVESGQQFVTGTGSAPASVDPFKLNDLFSPDPDLKKRYNQR